jgi:hypothetical protein
MPWKRNSPGCASCNCVAYLFGDGSASSPTYLDSRPNLTPKPLAEFSLAEGSIVAGAYTLTDGQRLAPRSSLLGCATAWSHEIDLIGDADLQWDGLTIALRATAGTVTIDGHTAAIMPTDATTRKVRLVLYVTPSWLMVAAIRYHIAPDEYTGNNRTTTTRSAVQVINRSNNFRDRVPVLTSVGTSTVLAWFAADATVSLSSGGYLGGYVGGYLNTITRDCYRPQLPEGLESNYQKQNEATTTYLGRTHPATFSIVGDPEAAAAIDYTFDDGSGPVTLRWSLADTIAAGLVRLVGTSTANFTWAASTAGAFTNTITGSLGPPIRGGLGTSSFVVRSETLTCCPSSPTSGDLGSHFATAYVDASTKAHWAAPTGATPYPKPAYRHALTVTQYTATAAILSQATTVATVTPSATSTTTATLITSTITDPITGTGAIRFTSIDVQWVTS